MSSTYYFTLLYSFDTLVTTNSNNKSFYSFTFHKIIIIIWKNGKRLYFIWIRSKFTREKLVVGVLVEWVFA
jgi:hypothetical protein